MTACFTLVSAASCLPARCFLRGQKAIEFSGSHAANWACGWLRRYGWEVTDNSVCCPNLAPGDVHLFGPFTKHLVGKRFAADTSVLQAVASCLQPFDTDFQHISFGATVGQMLKCQWRLRESLTWTICCAFAVFTAKSEKKVFGNIFLFIEIPLCFKTRCDRYV